MSVSPEAIEAIRKTVWVDATAEDAFAVFTERIGRWWPLMNYHIGRSAAETVIIEPHAGGRWYERGQDGSECQWGKVLVWEPPHRLVLAWQISAQWQFDPAVVTEIELRFVEEAGCTRLDFEHRKLEALGAAAPVIRKGLNGGWPTMLERFVQEAKIA